MGDAADLSSVASPRHQNGDQELKQADSMAAQSPQMKNDEGLASDLVQAEASVQENTIKSDAGRAKAASNGLRKSSPKGPESGDQSSKVSPAAQQQSTLKLKASRSNFTVPQPFSLTTEKRASAVSKSHESNGSPAQASLPVRPQAAKKAPSPIQHQTAVASSTAVAPKSNVEFVFKSDERAQKRMEFYASLSEKLKAREVEKSKMQAKSQQQIAAEIKKLRKDQTFKATPMPKFYQEPPPVRVDVKKTPPTRPKSPKLGRRGSTDRPTSAGAPKIIARRSSDEYHVAKATDPPTRDVQQSKTLVEPAKAEAGEQPAKQEQGLDCQPSSAKSDTDTVFMVPKAAVTDEEGQEHKQEVLQLSGSPDELSQFNGILHLPVSSSLLNDEDEDGEAQKLSDPADENRQDYFEHQEVHHEDEHLEQQLEEHCSDAAGKGTGRRHHDGGNHGEVSSSHDEVSNSHDEDVKVYISEKFRLAATAHPGKDREEEADDEEDEDDDDGEGEYDEYDEEQEEQAKVFVRQGD